MKYEIVCSGPQRKEVTDHLASDMNVVEEASTYIVIQSEMDWFTIRKYFTEIGVIVSRRSE